MKKAAIFIILLLLTGTTLFAQSPHETIKGNHISITYGRPYKKGRDIFGGLVPYNTVWRTGADKATEITLDKDCLFAGKQLNAGTYTLFTIPGKNEWTVILNNELNQWGAFGYDKVKDKNILESKVNIKHLENTVEQFTITITSNSILMDWDQNEAIIPVKFL